MPRSAVNGDDLSIGGRPFTFNPARNSLFVGSRLGHITEVSIPELVRETDLNRLWFGSYLQGLHDPLEGNMWQVANEGAFIEGIMVEGDKFYGTAAIYYDANNIQRVSHYTRSTQLGASSFVGLKPVWQPDHLGFVAGFMSPVPPEWQGKLGGRAITGQCCTPIAWKTSWGPSAFAWNPTDINSYSIIPATPLLYYSGEHQTLGHWESNGTTYSATTRMSGVALIAGTRTALYFGSTGVGEHCYGNGTSNASLHKTPSPDGTIWCYDPTNTDKGSHAFPYRYQIWAYDLNDFAAVKAGTKQPWEVVPYGVWPFELPVPEIHARLGGIAYDAKRQVIYISQMYADKDGYANRALIHALRVNNAPASLPAPTATTSTPTGSGTVATVTLAPSRTAPQPPGTTITWTATPSGGVRPYEYQWWVHDGVKWTTSAWTASNTFDWTPAAAAEYARVAIRVRSYASLEQYEATTEMWFPISGTATSNPTPTPTPTPTPPPTSTATSVTLAADRAAPQAPGTVIKWTAVPTGGVTPHQYQWWIYNGSWTAATGWTTSNTFNWQPATANSAYRVAVWVRSAGSTGSYETSLERSFAISGTAVTTPPPTTSPTAKATAVALIADKAAPQAPGTVITWTATPTGGVAPHQYQWWIYNGSWSAATSWTTSNRYAWQPPAANNSYRIAVWVRSAGSSGSYETSIERSFPISGTAVTTPPPPPPTASATAVTLTANLPSPQAPGTAIVWTAVPTGGVSPHQYQWWVYNGAWATATSWTTANTFMWQPSTANSSYRVAVWVRSAGSTGSYETSRESSFPISGTAVITPPPGPVVPGARATGVTITSNLASPQLAGTTVTWTATVAGGAAPYQYQWWTYDGARWVSMPWSTSNTFAWRPLAASSAWRVAVWIRSAGNTADHETSTERWFAIVQ